jgi:hypothetical protein
VTRYRIVVIDTTGRTRPWFDDGRTLLESDAVRVVAFIRRHFREYRVYLHSVSALEVAA